MNKHLKHIFPWASGLLVFGMYLLTIAPSVLQIDAGELATAQILLGIAHPTGYPFFTLTGHLFSLLPISGSPIYQMNLLAAFWCAGAIVLFNYIVRYLVENLDEFQSFQRVKSKKTPKQRKESIKNITPIEPVNPQKNIGYLATLFSASIGGFMLAFSKTFWDQGNGVEVYSAQAFLFMLFIGAVIRAYIISKTLPEKKFGVWVIAAICLGLGFTNHMTTMLLIPAGLYLFFIVYGMNRDSLITAAKLLIPLLSVIILVYLYLPIRASQSPILNWGNPIDFERFFRHVGAKQYQIWLFASTEAAKSQFLSFINNFPSEFNVSIIFVLFGIVFLINRARRLLMYLTILALFCILYVINYDIPDLASYFLLCYIALGFCAAFGVVQLFELLYDKKFQYGLALTASLLFIAIQVFYTVDKVDQHDNYIFEDYTISALNSVGKDGIVFTYQWDYLIAPSYYFQNVAKVRPDVTVIDKELLRRSWYFDQLKRNHPVVMSGVAGDVDALVKGLRAWERDPAFDAGYLEQHYRTVMTNLVAANIANRPYYIAIEVYENEMNQGKFALPEGYTVIPDLFFFRVVKGSAYKQAPEPNFTLRFPKNESLYSANIRKMVCAMLVRRAIYEMEYDRVERAKLYIKKLKTDFPDYPLPKGLAEVIVK